MKPEDMRGVRAIRSAVAASLLASLLTSCTSAGDTSQGIGPSVGTPALAATGPSAVSSDDGEGTNLTLLQADETAYAGGDVGAARGKLAPKATRARSPQGDLEAAAATAPLSLKRKTDATPAQLATATRPDLVDGGKREFLSSFLAKPQGKSGALAMASTRPLIARDTVPLGAAARGGEGKGRSLVQLASAERADAGASAHLYDGDALPGVRQTMLFEIRRKSGVDDESDVDLHEEDDAPRVRMASAAGMARLAPNGLLKQNETVDTACLKPALVAILRSAEQHFGQKAVITSGFRDPSHNRRVQGAKNSMHMYCAAADVQMAGVSRWELASYFRSMPGRGGVGTYCHTASVHVDIGPERDWNWKCGRRG